ncbi:hypothetical protein TESG_07610 [Trichophyton tonsurans CBS 112818]|uniref:Uncharacterized protein n=1 Tax=Trichophyton tonsurans (strain CBS 112818) TaxID=647933 RepID=F2S9R6_TRIT1|nr:hypothetical protein TESG_07610 [Trichophyton tonsurans CBS 112818]
MASRKRDFWYGVSEVPENYLHLRTALFILFYLSTGENRILSSRSHSHRSFKKDKGPVRRIRLDVINNEYQRKAPTLPTHSRSFRPAENIDLRHPGLMRTSAMATWGRTLANGALLEPPGGDSTGPLKPSATIQLPGPDCPRAAALTTRIPPPWNQRAHDGKDSAKTREKRRSPTSTSRSSLAHSYIFAFSPFPPARSPQIRHIDTLLWASRLRFVRWMLAVGWPFVRFLFSTIALS